METIFDLPVLALRNIPESIVSKLHQVTSTATGYDAIQQQAAAAQGKVDAATNNTQTSSPPLVILDGTKIVSRVHLGCAIRKTLINIVGSTNNNNNSATNMMSPSQLIQTASRAVSPRRLQSPSRLSPSRRRGAGAGAEEEKQQQQQGNQKKQQQPRIASQLVFTLNTTKSHAIKNFVLHGQQQQQEEQQEQTQQSQQDAASLVHPAVVIVFDAEISPCEAWRWVKSAGGSSYVVSLENLHTTVNSEEVCRIYGLDPAAELSSSLSRSGCGPKGSNMPSKVITRDISWLERQVVSKIATNGL